jgi:hypothetical protein
MHYACSNCGFERPFYLEVGCEGPKVPSKQIAVPEALRGRIPSDMTTVRATMDGRVIVPVPFIACQCHCGGYMQHVRWEDDQTFDPPLSGDAIPIMDACMFFYPEDGGRDPQACGTPVYPRKREKPKTGQDHTPVPVSAAREIGQRYRKSQVAVISWDPVSGLVHTTTWGETPSDKVQAARLGEILTEAAGGVRSLRTQYEDLPGPLREAVDAMQILDEPEEGT